MGEPWPLVVSPILRQIPYPDFGRNASISEKRSTRLAQRITQGLQDWDRKAVRDGDRVGDENGRLARYYGVWKKIEEGSSGSKGRSIATTCWGGAEQ